MESEQVEEEEHAGEEKGKATIGELSHENVGMWAGQVELRAAQKKQSKQEIITLGHP